MCTHTWMTSILILTVFATMLNYFSENVSKHFLHPPCLAQTLTLSSSLTEFDPSAELAVPRETAGNKGTFAGKMGRASGDYALNRGSLGYGSIVLPGARVKPPVICSNWLMGPALSRAKSARNPAMTRGWATRRHFFMAVIWYGCLSGKPYRIAHTHELVCPQSASCSSLAHIHTSAEKTPRTHTPVSDGPVFHWGIIDWKMKMDACTSQALLINETRRVYYGGPAPVPTTSRGRAVSLRHWPPITALTGWVTEHPHDIEAAVHHCRFGRQRYPFSSVAIHYSEWGKEMGWKWAE